MAFMPELRRIAVIGAGTAGLGFAIRCVSSGYDVTLEDVMPSRLRRAQDEFSAFAAGNGPGNIHLASTVEDAVRHADLAIDFVPDELESKLEIFSMLDRMAPPSTIFCTPTDALSIADLASCTYRPQLCFALRGFVSGPQSSAELICTSQSAPEALTSVQAWLKRLGFSVNVKPDPVESQFVARPFAQ